jgi:acetyl-CoA carboxylase biotin carboxyl carrier protein
VAEVSVDLPLNPEDVAEIVAILEGSGYERFELRTSRFTLRVARAGEGWTQQWDWGATVAKSSVAPSVGKVVEQTPIAAPSAEDDGLVAILPPLPGTFYRAPQPGAPPFVKEGAIVNEDTVVGIVETMKLMNPVHAHTRGKVVAILVPDGTLIDAHTVLMRVAPEDQ